MTDHINPSAADRGIRHEALALAVAQTQNVNRYDASKTLVMAQIFEYYLRTGRRLTDQDMLEMVDRGLSVEEVIKKQTTLTD